MSLESSIGRHMIKVRPRPNESVQQLMRRLKKLCEREGVLREMKRTAYYEKPSDRRRRNMRKAKRRLQKMLQLETPASPPVSGCPK